MCRGRESEIHINTESKARGCGKGYIPKRGAGWINTEATTTLSTLVNPTPLVPSHLREYKVAEFAHSLAKMTLEDLVSLPAMD